MTTFAHFIDTEAQRDDKRNCHYSYIVRFRAAMLEDFRKNHVKFGGPSYGHGYVSPTTGGEKTSSSRSK